MAEYFSLPWNNEILEYWVMPLSVFRGDYPGRKPGKRFVGIIF